MRFVRFKIHWETVFLDHLPIYYSEKDGMFINISSFMGVTTAVPVGSLYNMSKFALEGLTEVFSLRDDF